MSRQTECIDGFLKRAQADQTVYVTDVRRVFDEVGEKAFHVHAHLYEGAVEVFDMSVPKWETEEQRDFVAEYIRAFLYNLISTLGAIRIEIYLDAADEGLRALAEGLREDFQLDLDKTERSGYGKCLNVNERIVKALTGGKRRFTIGIRDLGEEPEDAKALEEPTGGAVFEELPARAKKAFLLGVDVGGTDIKFAASLDGKLVHCEELNWAPASFSNVEQLIDPVMETAERLMKQFGAGRKWDGIGLSWPDAIIHNMIVGGETTKTKAPSSTI